jgi:hypothetical protein
MTEATASLIALFLRHRMIRCAQHVLNTTTERRPVT